MIQKFYDYGSLDFGGDSTPKPYFAKYLPVEGEIKEGDFWIYKGYSMSPINIDFDPYPQDKGLKEKQKVKLFLCSRDVKMGDKVKIEDGSFNDYQIDREEQIFNGHLFYKIVGELSPEATWVKEGDEFDEHEVYKLEGVINALNGQTVPTWCVIKGPCGHFH